MQLNIMNSRAIDHIAQSKERGQLAGDQLFIDLDISEENTPPGTQLSIGKELHLRGVNAKAVHSGTIRAGNTISKVRIDGQK